MFRFLAVLLLASPLLIGQTSLPPTLQVMEGTLLRLAPGNPPNNPDRIQWFRDGVEVPGQTHRTFAIANAAPSDAGLYHAVYYSAASGDAESARMQVEIVPNTLPPFEWRGTTPNGGSPGFLTVLGGKFLLGNPVGLFLSEDGDTWTRANVPLHPFTGSPQFSQIIEYKGRYYAFQSSVYPGGWTSDDLVNWTLSPDLPGGFNVVIGGDTILMKRTDAPSSSSERRFWVSSDLQNWTRVESVGFYYPASGSVNYHQGNFITASDLRVSISPDGLNWTDVENLPAGLRFSSNSRTLPVIDGKLTTISHEHLYQSADGVSWTATEITKNAPGGRSPFHNSHRSDITEALGLFWVFRYYSSDLVTWEESEGVDINSVLHHAGTGSLLLAVDSRSTISRVTDPQVEGVSLPNYPWQERLGDSTPELILGFYLGSAYASTDGFTWDPVRFSRLLRQNGVHLIWGRAPSGGNRLGIHTSTDFVNWNSEIAVGVPSSRHLAAGNGRFVAVDDDDFFIWSENGVDWNQTSVSADGFDFTVFSGGQFVSFSEQRSDPIAVYLSPDGETWTRREIDTDVPRWITGAIERNGQLLLVGEGVFLSEDGGQSWEINTSVAPASIAAIVWHEGSFYFSFEGLPYLYSSRNARDWARAEVGVGGPLGVFNNQLLIGGSGGFRLISGERPVERAIIVSGIDESAMYAAGELVDLEVHVENFQPGDRIEMWIGGALVASTDQPGLSYRWRLGPLGMQTLRVLVVQADGGEISQTVSVDVGSPQAVILDETPTPLTRRSYQWRVGDVFFDVTEDGLVRTSNNLLDWSEAALPGVPAGTVIDWPEGLARRDGGGYMLRYQDLFWHSDDLSAWELRTAPPVDDLTAGRLFATADWFLFFDRGLLGRRPAVMYRTNDGIAWEGPFELPFVPGDFHAQIAGHLHLVASGGLEHTAIWRTLDGENWTSVFAAPGSEMRDLNIHDGEALAVLRDTATDSFFIARSPDGLQWDILAVSPAGVRLDRIIAGGGGTYLAEGFDGRLLSTDLQNWVPQPLDTTFGDPIWLNGEWVSDAIGPSGYAGYLTSPDLISWTLLESPGGFRQVTRIEHIDGDLVFVAGVVAHLLHPDGRWSHLAPGVDIHRIARWHNKWVVGNEELRIAILGRDGATVADLHPRDIGTALVALLVHGDALVVLAEHGSYWTIDGQDWDFRPFPFEFTAGYGTFFGGTFVAAGETEAAFAWSDDLGRTWTHVPRPAFSGDRSTDFSGFHPGGDGLLYFSQRNGSNFRSPDGRSWEAVPPEIDGGFYLNVPIDTGQAHFAGNHWDIVPGPPLESFNVAVFPSQYFNGRIVGTGEVSVGGNRVTNLHVTPLADLVPVFSDPVPAAAPGEALAVSFTIENLGFDAAYLDEPLRIDLRLSANTVFGDEDDVPLGVLYHGSSHRHRVGEVSALTFSTIIPEDLPPGAHFLALRLHDATLPLDYSLSNNTVFSLSPVVSGGVASRAVFAPLDDPDRDGLPSILEHLLGSDPFSTAGPPPWTIAPQTNGELAVRFRVRKEADAALVLQASRDLQSWHDLPRGSWTPAGEDAAFRFWAVPLPAGERQFIRFAGF